MNHDWKGLQFTAGLKSFHAPKAELCLKTSTMGLKTAKQLLKNENVFINLVFYNGVIVANEVGWLEKAKLVIGEWNPVENPYEVLNTEHIPKFLIPKCKIPKKKPFFKRESVKMPKETVKEVQSSVVAHSQVAHSQVAQYAHNNRFRKRINDSIHISKLRILKKLQELRPDDDVVYFETSDVDNVTPPPPPLEDIDEPLFTFYDSDSGS